jgi:hypothetical protein
MKKESWDDIEDSNKVSDIFNSEEFKESFRKRIEADTWGNDLPMVYMDSDGWIVKHWKDGTIEKISKPII